MKQRVITAICLVAGLAAVFFLLPVWVSAVIFGIFASIGAYELLFVTGSVPRHFFLYVSMIVAFAVPVVSVCGQDWQMTVLIYAYMVAALACGALFYRHIGFAAVAKGFMAAVLMPYMLASVVRLLAFDEVGKYIVAIPWVLVWMSDSMALLVGKRFGKRKLAPYVSPKKTVAGFVGGIVGGVAGMTGYCIVMDIAFGWQPGSGAVIALLVFGLVGAAMGQLGDLSMSAIKRECGIKDYGSLFPGHGGVWDRFDSVLFVAPLLEIVLRRLI